MNKPNATLFGVDSKSQNWMTVKLTQICFNFEPFEALSLSFSSKPESKITSYNYFILQHRESPTITYKKTPESKKSRN